MYSGNHSPLLSLPAKELSEDHVTGEGKAESLTFPLSFFFFFFFWTMPSVTHSGLLWTLSFPLSIFPLRLRGVSLH